VWEIVTWKDAERFRGLVTFIAATRPGYDLDAAQQVHAEELARIDIHFIEVPALAISSTGDPSSCCGASSDPVLDARSGRSVHPEVPALP
jgi:nicotinic acid mononucleotide adenylyltransferase